MGTWAMMAVAIAAAVGVALAGRESRMSGAMAPHVPPSRVITGVRESLTPLLRPDSALNQQAAQELTVGLWLAFLHATRQAGDSAAVPHRVSSRNKIMYVHSNCVSCLAFTS